MHKPILDMLLTAGLVFAFAWGWQVTGSSCLVGTISLVGSIGIQDIIGRGIYFGYDFAAG